jgi:phosphatidylserine synthase
VPPEAFTKSGELQISIVLFDQVDGKIAFSWNTAPFFGLSVGATLDSVGDYIYGD